ncbi:DUF6228 family protein [Streptomyces sp. NPDC056105]|uniref:DUF6228 family protein n=1 Tax=Streptomyces sp. NPDC056105 TaxID=3345714 RepID=UPI0035E16B75
MTSLDGATSDHPAVAVSSVNHAAVGVRLSDRRPFDEGAVHYVVEAWAPGLAARVDEVVAWVWDADLADFLAGLAADYRAWEGERTWQTYDGDLAVSAVSRSGGRIGLTWTLRPWPDAAGGWTVSVTTWLEAGAQMASLAADVRHFLASKQPG